MIFTILKETDSNVSGDVSYEGCKYKKSGQELIGFDGTWEAKREKEDTESNVHVCNAASDDDYDDDDLIKSERVEELKSVKGKKLKPEDRSEKFLPVKHSRQFYKFSSSA